MKELCPYEAVVSAAVQSGRWEEEASDHVASCIHCSEVIRASEWTRSLAAEPDWPPLRDPDLIWIEARLLSARIQSNRTVQVFVVLEGACVALLSASAAGLVLNREQLRGLPSEILEWIGRLGNLGPLTTDPFSTASASTLLFLLIAVTFLIHPFLLEE